MRPDVKLGVVISLIVVVVAGSYYFYRDQREKPIALSDGTSPVDAVGRQAKKPDAKSREAARPAGRTPGSRVKRSNRQPVRETSSPRSPTGARSQDAGKRKPHRVARKPESAPVSKRASGPAASPAEQRKGQVGHASTEKVTTKATAPSLNRPGNRRNKIKPNRVVRGPAEARRTAQGTPGRARNRKTSERDAAAPAEDLQAERVAAARRAGAPPRTSPPAQARPAAAVDTHRVQPGDTFAALSVAYYGSERHTQFLIDANPQVHDPGRLRVGDRLKIPALPPDQRKVTLAATRPVSSRPVPSSSDDTAREPDSGRRTYVVKPGDSFYAIARDVLADESRWEELFELNKALVRGDPKRLQPGQVIVLP